MQLQRENFRAAVEKLEKQMEAFYLSNVASRWLSLRLQLLSALLIGAIGFLGVAMSSRLSSGVVGLTLTYALRLTDVLNMLNTSTADRETQMVSVERVHGYSIGIQREAPLENEAVHISPSWPRTGDVTLRNVVARYRPELPLVLHGVTLTIKGGERVGIVGRTGCGKSSLMMVLMRMVELESGQISIDNVDIGTLGLHSLRSKVAMVPQEPTILSGSVRFNLDPLGLHDDAQLLVALEKAEMKGRVETAGGLDGAVEESGGNFSMGELQLLCLARALLRRLPQGGLLLLDEATSSLDAETDAKIQRIIMSEFTCTTIAIAHRIDTLLDYDRIVVLDGGLVMENDSPKALLARESRFKALAVEGKAVTAKR